MDGACGVQRVRNFDGESAGFHTRVQPAAKAVECRGVQTMAAHKPQLIIAKPRVVPGANNPAVHVAPDIFDESLKILPVLVLLDEYVTSRGFLLLKLTLTRGQVITNESFVPVQFGEQRLIKRSGIPHVNGC